MRQGLIGLLTAFWICAFPTIAFAHDGFREPELVDADAEVEGVEGRIYRAVDSSRFDRLLEIANGDETDSTRWTVSRDQFDAANPGYVNYVCLVRGDRAMFRRNGPGLTWDGYQRNCRASGGSPRRELLSGHRYFVPMVRRLTAAETVTDATGALRRIASAARPSVDDVNEQLDRLIAAGRSDDAPPEFSASVPAFEALRTVTPRIAGPAGSVRPAGGEHPSLEPGSAGDTASASDEGESRSEEGIVSTDAADTPPGVSSTASTGTIDQMAARAIDEIDAWVAANTWSLWLLAVLATGVLMFFIGRWRGRKSVGAESYFALQEKFNALNMTNAALTAANGKLREQLESRGQNFRTPGRQAEEEAKQEPAKVVVISATAPTEHQVPDGILLGIWALVKDGALATTHGYNKLLNRIDLLTDEVARDALKKLVEPGYNYLQLEPAWSASYPAVAFTPDNIRARRSDCDRATKKVRDLEDAWAAAFMGSECTPENIRKLPAEYEQQLKARVADALVKHGDMVVADREKEFRAEVGRIEADLANREQQVQARHDDTIAEQARVQERLDDRERKLVERETVLAQALSADKGELEAFKLEIGLMARRVGDSLTRVQDTIQALVKTHDDSGLKNTELARLLEVAHSDVESIRIKGLGPILEKAEGKRPEDAFAEQLAAEAAKEAQAQLDQLGEADPPVDSDHRELEPEPTRFAAVGTEPEDLPRDERVSGIGGLPEDSLEPPHTPVPPAPDPAHETDEPPVIPPAKSEEAEPEDLASEPTQVHGRAFTAFDSASPPPPEAVPEELPREPTHPYGQRRDGGNGHAAAESPSIFDEPPGAEAETVTRVSQAPGPQSGKTLRPPAAPPAPIALPAEPEPEAAEAKPGDLPN